MKWLTAVFGVQLAEVNMLRLQKETVERKVQILTPLFLDERRGTREHQKFLFLLTVRLHDGLFEMDEDGFGCEMASDALGWKWLDTAVPCCSRRSAAYRNR